MLARNKYKGKSGTLRIKNAIIYSTNGIYAAWKDEEAFRQVTIIFIISFLASIILSKSWSDFILLIIPSVLCIIIELVNSAIENISDATTTETNNFIKKAKDMGSAAQLITQIFLYTVWTLFIFCEYL